MSEFQSLGVEDNIDDSLAAKFIPKDLLDTTPTIIYKFLALLLFFLLLIISSFSLLHSRPRIIFHPRYHRFPDIRRLSSCKFDKIFQLGDSISDTGNLIRETPFGALTAFARLPYGETFFKYPTGRCSNGRLMIDYIAWAAGIPFLNPYKNGNASFDHGVNFAVAGATALPVQNLAAKNITSSFTNSSLNVQLDWMSTHIASLCKADTDCTEKLKNSLFMVGEIGGNDYNYALFGGKPLEEVQSMVPDVVQGIMNAVRRVIHFGAPRVIIPGNFPIGCLPSYLTGFQTNNSAAYDNHYCLKELNNLAVYHNDQLQEAIEKLKQEIPNTIIIYADYYNAFKWLLSPNLGFDATCLQKSCCGTGGDYNFNMMRMCGAPNVSVCPNPDQYISWDGIHLTQKAYEIMATWLINNILPKIKCHS